MGPLDDDDDGHSSSYSCVSVSEECARFAADIRVTLRSLVLEAATSIAVMRIKEE